MSLFQMLRRETVSKKADVYSYGIIAWEIIAQKVPFSEVEPFFIPIAIANGQVGNCIASASELTPSIICLWSCFDCWWITLILMSFHTALTTDFTECCTNNSLYIDNSLTVASNHSWQLWTTYSWPDGMLLEKPRGRWWQWNVWLHTLDLVAVICDTVECM